MNKKKLYRLYREEGLAVRRRRGRKRATGTRAPMALPNGPNHRNASPAPCTRSTSASSPSLPGPRSGRPEPTR